MEVSGSLRNFLLGPYIKRSERGEERKVGEKGKRRNGLCPFKKKSIIA